MVSKTERLFEADVYCRTFTAKVLACKEENGFYQIVLNRTAFYPEGGGQPADIGVLNTVNVLDAQEKQGIVYHKTDRPLLEGSTVTGGIHWPRRFGLMQQHTGEHMVSGIAHRLFGVNNVGFHMGSQAVTVDFDRVVTAEQMATVERLANDIVFRNLPVTASYPQGEALEQLDYRSKKALEGPVRIITIERADVCACCGTHVSHTGEIGLIKIISVQNYKGGVRISMLCGWDALRDYIRKEQSVGRVSNLLSAKSDEIAVAVEHLLEENNRLKQEIYGLREEKLKSRVEALPPDTDGICLFEEGLQPDDVRRLCLMACEHCSGTAAVFSGSDSSGYRYAVGNISEDVRPLGKEMNHALQGRGGGSKELIQGSLCASKEEIERFFQKR